MPENVWEAPDYVNVAFILTFRNIVREEGVKIDVCEVFGEADKEITSQNVLSAHSFWFAFICKCIIFITCFNKAKVDPRGFVFSTVTAAGRVGSAESVDDHISGSSCLLFADYVCGRYRFLFVSILPA